ncbi:MAG: hypothetical protein CL766_04750 [Chloroflexi bacterium]|nr:hypothetical protein [Chloroflexota bacterium]
MPKMNFLKQFSRDNSGITGLETAIILIAFVVVAAVFAFTVMTTGLFSTEKAKTTAQAALTEASSSFILKGAITAKCELNLAGDACDNDAAVAGGTATPYINQIAFQIALASGADQQTMIPGEMAFIYSDSNNNFTTPGGADADLRDGIIMEVAITEIVSGTTVGVLEAGDTAQVVVTLSANTASGVAPAPANDTIHLGANTKFRIEMIAPKGGTLIIERTTPKVLTANMNLE